MGAIQVWLASNWGWTIVMVVALTILIVLLWRNFDIEELTPTPPFVKLKRKAKPMVNSNPALINITGNKLWGKNKISVRRDNSNVANNTLMGENELEVGAKPGRKPKKGNRSK
jgi:hypothetical protein